MQPPESLRRSLNLDVRTGAEVVSIDTSSKTVVVCEVAGKKEYAESYDRLVLCPGATPVIDRRRDRRGSRPAWAGRGPCAGGSSGACHRRQPVSKIRGVAHHSP